MNEEKSMNLFFLKKKLKLKQLEEIEDEINDECLDLYRKNLRRDIELTKKKIEDQKADIIQLRNLMITLAGLSFVLIGLFWNIEVFASFEKIRKLLYGIYFALVFVVLIILVILSVIKIGKSPDITTTIYNVSDTHKIMEITLKKPKILKLVDYMNLESQRSLLEQFVNEQSSSVDISKITTYVLIFILAILLFMTFCFFGLGL